MARLLFVAVPALAWAAPVQAAPVALLDAPRAEDVALSGHRMPGGRGPGLPLTG